MKNLINHFIAIKYKNKIFSGQFTGTSMFLDIIGFTKITESLAEYGREGVEILSNLINGLFDPSIKRVYERGGFVAEFEGDSFLAFFNAQDDALLAAGEIIAEFEKQSNKDTKFGNFCLKVKIGISYGEVEWSIAGNKTKKSYYFKGEAVDSSAKLESLSIPGILIDENIFRMSGHLLKTQKLFEGAYRIQQINFSKIGSKSFSIKIDPDIQKIFTMNLLFEDPPLPEFRSMVCVFISFRIMEKNNLDAFTSDIIDISEKWGGYFNRISFSNKGGTTLVNFGIPLSQESNVQRALGFIIDVRDIYKNKIRAAITYGTMFAGFIGSNIISSYDVLGDPVNLAARIAMSEDWGTIWVSGDIIKLGKGELSVNFEKKIKIKDRKELFTIFELKDYSRKKAKHFCGKIRGRDKEINDIKSFISPVFQKKFAGTIYIYGSAGIGKSMLIHSLFDDRTDLNYYSLHCDSILKKSFNPVKDFLEAYFGQKSFISADDRVLCFERAFDDLTKNIDNKTIIEDLNWHKPGLMAILALNPHDSYYHDLQPKEKREYVLNSAKTLFKALSLLKPLVLHIEDIQWIDETSNDFLPYLTTNISDFPISIICTARYNDDGTKPSLQINQDIKKMEIILKGISEDSAIEMMSDILNAKPDTKLSDFIQAKTANNPFFIEQYCLYMMEKDYIKINKCGFMTISKKTSDIPDLIDHIIIARLDRLSRDMRELTKIASVIGVEWDKDLLSMAVYQLNRYIDRLSGFDNGALQSMVLTNIDSLLKKGEIENLWEKLHKGKYIFKNSLLRDVAYNVQLNDRLRTIHGHIAKGIEKLANNKTMLSKDHFLDLAYHYQKASIQDKTIEYFKKAADYMRDIYNNNKAIDLYEKLLQNLYDEKQRILIIFETASLYELLGKWEDADRSIKECIRLSEKLEDKHFLARSYSIFGNLLLKKGHLKKSLEAHNYAGKLFREINDLIGYAKQKNNEGLSYYQSGKYDKAMECFNICRNISAEQKDMVLLGYTTGNIGIVHFSRGRYKEALDCYEIKGAICKEIGDKRSMINSENNIGLIYLNQGNCKKALDRFHKAEDLSMEIGFKRGIATTNSHIGLAYYQQGQYHKALKFYSRAECLARELGDKTGILLAMIHTGLIHLKQGKLTIALKTFKKSASLSKNIGDKEGLGACNANIGQVYLEHGKYDLAMKYFSKAKKAFKELNNNLGIARTYSYIGHIFLLKGNLPISIKYLKKAYDIFSYMNNPEGIASCLEKLSRSYMASGEVDKAVSNSEKAVNVLLKLDGDKRELLNALLVKAEAMIISNRHKEAKAVIKKGLDLSKEPGFGDFETKFKSLYCKISSP